ncbi:MAG TPA: L-glutamate gamma-semialdehyde dehydrogenase [Candidatus Kapabacteria bacterium]|nr:L-glutamate gamma-semialdehyde dehydrogenase [Candidatus Kapabacteria bacterium]
MQEFRNMTYLDFTNEEVFNQQKAALNKVREQLGKEYPNIIGGKNVFTDKKTTSYNPSHKNEVVGIFQKGGKEQAEEAIQVALKAFETWKYTPAHQRAEYLFKAAAIMKERRLEINAWMITEAGKNFLEADADTCEAIDFMEFYAHEAIRHGKLQDLTPYPGEKNEYFYIPLGVGVCIPPWNFPFAIMAGISAAGFATGNTVVMKPSSETPMMAYLFADIMKEAGLPDGVLNYFVASGSEAGDYLVDHPKTRFISFTGSMEVGLRIMERAAKINPGQIWIKRVIAEMGGKDAIIVDSEADIDVAVQGVVAAAFGFQGQKCSACSRAIVDEKIYDVFVAKLKEETAKLEIGFAEDNAKVGPVISAKAESTILNYINIGKEEGKLLIGGNKVESLDGYYIEPTIFIDIDEKARLAQEEIFGPVLAVIKAKDYDHALNIANNTIYGLTGAVYSNNPAKLERAKVEFHCGNLYLNRKCTGAMVDVHPFGGFNMSGTDSKAGSRDYFMLFLQGKSVATKI